MVLTHNQMAIWKKWALFDFEENALIEELKKTETLPFPLFHGSNRFALSLTVEQRKAYREACMILVPYYYEAYQAADYLHLDDAVFGSDAGSIQNAYYVADRFCDDSSNFEYEATYLAADVGVAARYAEDSWYCGELHSAVHWLRIGAEKMKLQLQEPDTAQQKALQLLDDCESGEKSEAVLLRFDNFPKELLLSKEDGSEINWAHVMFPFLSGMPCGNFRVPTAYDLLSNGTPVPLTQESLEAIWTQNKQIAEELLSERKKRAFRQLMLEEGFSLEDIQAVIDA